MPTHESIRETPSRHTHTFTDHFLRLGKGSYWRILSGKRTFSNKWWWTLDEKPLLAHLFFFFLFFPPSPFCLLDWHSAASLLFCPALCSTLDRLKRCRCPGFMRLDPQSATPTKIHAIFAFRNPEWKRISSCLDVFLWDDYIWLNRVTTITIDWTWAEDGRGPPTQRCDKTTTLSRFFKPERVEQCGLQILAIKSPL